MNASRRTFLAVSLGAAVLTASETLHASRAAGTPGAGGGGAQNNGPDAPPPLPPGGTPLLPADPFVSALTVTGQRDAVAAERVAVTGMPFTTALRLTTKSRVPLPYSVQLSGPPTGATRTGDVLFLRCYVRTVKGQAETGEARSEFVFEMSQAPHEKAVTYGISVPAPAKGWKRIDLPFTAQRDLAANEAQIGFRLGYDPQSFEIGGVQLINYGRGFDIARLPRTRASYNGMEADAPWRAEAARRIEKLRKGDLTVRVVDGNGKPVRNADVTVEMTRHAFPFGSAVAAEQLLAQNADGERYRATVKRLFNRVVMENDLKWEPYEQNPARAKAGVDWLRAQNIEVRGHNLIWPSWRNSPRDLQSLSGDKTALAKRIDDHIRAEATAFRGKLVDWDVINEPYDNHDVMDILGRDAMIRWFKIARESDPTARLFLNDYPPLDGGDSNNPHLNAFFQNIEFLRKGGAPLDGIGFQGHFGGNVIPPTRLLTGLDRFGKFGLPIAITEFDINSTDRDLQSAYMRDFLTALFSHPATDSIIMWGFWEGRHWLPDAALYARDWSVRPHGRVFEDLVHKEWRTTATVRTDKNGVAKVRGFLGDYALRANAGKDRIATGTAKLGKRGATATLTLVRAEG